MSNDLKKVENLKLSESADANDSDNLISLRKNLYSIVFFYLYNFDVFNDLWTASSSPFIERTKVLKGEDSTKS